LHRRIRIVLNSLRSLTVVTKAECLFYFADKPDQCDDIE